MTKNKIKKPTVYNVWEEKGGRDGTIVTINFTSHTKISVNDLVCIEYEDKKRYFEVSYVTTLGADEKDSLFVTAKNFGRYNLLKNIDLRNLLNCEIDIVTDKDEIEKIRREEHYM